ncbi:hypothetical protein O988_09870, partial [Pseudogymnoascus sp. VKM F-3808]
GVLRFQNIQNDTTEQRHQQQWQPTYAPPVYISPYTNFHEATERQWHVINHEALLRRADENTVLKQQLAKTHAQVETYKAQAQDYATQLEAIKNEAAERAKKAEWGRAARRKTKEEIAMKKEARTAAQRKKLEEACQAKAAKAAARRKKLEEAAQRKEAKAATRRKKLEEAAQRKEARTNAQRRKLEEACQAKAAKATTWRKELGEAAQKKDARVNAQRKKSEEVAYANTLRRAKRLHKRRKMAIKRAQLPTGIKITKVAKTKEQRSEQLRLSLAKRTIRQYEDQDIICGREVIECTERLLVSKEMKRALGVFMKDEIKDTCMNDAINHKTCTFPGAWRGKFSGAAFLPFLQRWQGLNASHFRNAPGNPTQSPSAMAVARATFCETHHRNVHSLCTYAFTAWASASLSELQDYARGLLQASHLCSHGGCSTPGHIVLEIPRVNMNRRNCERVAIYMRDIGMKIPHACNQHTPPCLLREAALTRLELLFTTFIAIHKLNHTDVTKPFENSELIGTLDAQLKSLPTFKVGRVVAAAQIYARNDKRGYNADIAEGGGGDNTKDNTTMGMRHTAPGTPRDSSKHCDCDTSGGMAVADDSVKLIVKLVNCGLETQVNLRTMQTVANVV